MDPNLKYLKTVARIPDMVLGPKVDFIDDNGLVLDPIEADR